MEFVFIFTHLIMLVCAIVIMQTAIPFKKLSLALVRFPTKNKWRSSLRKQVSTLRRLQIKVVYKPNF